MPQVFIYCLIQKVFDKSLKKRAKTKNMQKYVSVIKENNEICMIEFPALLVILVKHAL